MIYRHTFRTDYGDQNKIPERKRRDRVNENRYKNLRYFLKKQRAHRKSSWTHNLSNCRFWTNLIRRWLTYKERKRTVWRRCNRSTENVKIHDLDFAIVTALTTSIQQMTSDHTTELIRKQDAEKKSNVSETKISYRYHVRNRDSWTQIFSWLREGRIKCRQKYDRNTKSPDGNNKKNFRTPVVTWNISPWNYFSKRDPTSVCETRSVTDLERGDMRDNYPHLDNQT